MLSEAGLIFESAADLVGGLTKIKLVESASLGGSRIEKSCSYIGSDVADNDKFANE